MHLSCFQIMNTCSPVDRQPLSLSLSLLVWEGVSIITFLCFSRFIVRRPFFAWSTHCPAPFDAAHELLDLWDTCADDSMFCWLVASKIDANTGQ